MGHELVVVGRYDGWLKSRLDPKIKYIDSELSRNPFELKRIANLIRNEKVDVIHSHMSRAHSFGVLLKLITGVPVVATAHAHSFQVHWRLNDFVIANSQATFDYQVRVNRIPVQKMEKVFCFTALERFKHVTPLKKLIVRRQLRLTENEFLAGVVGDVAERKGHIHLIEAIPEIVKAIPNFKLVLLGRFNRSEPLVKKIRGLQLKHKIFRRVKWIGIRDNVEDFMSAFDLCVVPSLIEPLGLVALESLAAGTPVVAAATGGLKEIVEHEKTGLLVPSGDSDSLAKAIVQLAQSEPDRIRMGENGRAMVHDKFDPAKLTVEVERILQTVASKKGRSQKSGSRKVA